MVDPRFFSGQFLLATPGMGDPRFSHSIIAMCAHDEHGALGINLEEKSSNISLHNILKELEIETNLVEDRAVFIGGPVENHRGFILHSLDLNLSDTLQVGEKWGLSSSIDMLRAIANNRGPENWVIALGYSGWGEGQLENELTQNGWMVAEGSKSWIFETAAESKWRMAWEELGIDPSKLSSGFGSA